MSLPTIAFLTALPLEFEAVVAHLPTKKPKPISNRTYTLGKKNGYQIVVRQQYEPKNVAAAIETAWLIQHFQPTYLFFVGVAGGIKEVDLGEVVVARSARGYEDVKVKDGVVYPRQEVVYSSPSLVEQASELAPDRQPKTQVNVIASGNKLVSDKTWLEEIARYCSDAVAVEMEAIGFLGSIRQHEGIKGIMIRGISDLIVGKNAEKDKYWQPIAAKNAAAFAFAMVDKLPLPPSTIEQPAKSQGIFAVPNFLTAYFTGREDLLQNIHALLAEKHVVALHGLGGVGKTQTLLEYARLHRTDYPVVLWMAAESEHSFQQGFLKLAQDLGCRCQSTR